MNQMPEDTDTSNISIRKPDHIAVIMDGNGRWAQKRGLPRVAGHRQGGEAVRRLIRLAIGEDISYLTVFAFSSENWRRPEQEVGRLMDLFVQALDKDIGDLHNNNVRFNVIGDLVKLDKSVVDRIHHSEELTKNNSGMVFTVALNYGGWWDITQACQNIARQVEKKELDPELIDANLITENLSTHGLPNPDLFIRTGGEKRLSNFLLWQLAYTELYFSDTLWPDFNEKEFHKALEYFTTRQRRFGKTSDQVKAI